MPLWYSKKKLAQDCGLESKTNNEPYEKRRLETSSKDSIPQDNVTKNIPNHNLVLIFSLNTIRAIIAVATISKILLEFMPPTLMAGFLYVGAGIGMIFIALMRKIKKYEAKELKLTKSELPYTFIFECTVTKRCVLVFVCVSHYTNTKQPEITN